ncbi:HTH-type transcriptional activator RhaS [Aquisphaera giovannonii]|uniref:HTH-type transcriptional activator RhaS n=1 Tax=Aquisphaera giovannonii TaxID=406548 RepID=A0A5B9W331_9BACT|nr:helix-turn-helix domain-containing protein [Aquisphaera giovannonii]QEH34657.1 HTH-type transcriptional activator RhaS [Aquisphaera giovannonii]
MSRRSPRPGDPRESGVESFERFVEALAPGSQFHVALNHLADTRVVVKDRRGRFLWVSDNVPARHGYASGREMLGLTDVDINPKELAAVYGQDDTSVLRTGRPILGKTEIAFDEAGLPAWFLVNKLPLRDRRRRVVGLIATIQDIPEGRTLPSPGGELRTVIDAIRSQLDRPLRIGDLASLIHVSARQLERRFLQATGLTPSRYIARCRIAEACRRLRDTDEPVGRIAVAVGFYDQSAFTKVFRRQLGLTPLQFRRSRSRSSGA